VSPAAPPALLVLEDGAAFRGTGVGAEGEAFGEAVFNTGMTGYQEVLTDPSYLRQIVTMTAPHQGVYGVTDEDAQSDRVRVAAFVAREVTRQPSSWRATGDLAGYLAAAGVAGIEGIDTRRLTLRIRSGGAMRAGVSTVDLDPGSLVERVRATPGMEGQDLATAASCEEPYAAEAVVGPASSDRGRVRRVAAYDFGIKRTILRQLAENGCEATIFPARTPPDVVLAGGFDGVFLSNGPGDPAATTYAIEAVRRLLGRIPVFGICLGHQVLAHALGGRTFKLRFGHRGVNQPVKDVESGRVAITSHNHGFAVDPAAWAADGDGSAVDTERGRVVLSHWNLNDGTLEGLRCLDIPAFSVQYHPEAAPGPNDARPLFERFRRLMG
jgi:carbamoyl-phosphate synthase small subunit